MKITIIGATKGIGKEVLGQATDKDFELTVLARNPEKLKNFQDKLNIIKGDFLNYESVKLAITNADTIVVTVGMNPTGRSVELFSKGTKNILEAVKELKTHPLIIAITGIGAGDSEGHGGFFYDKIFKPLLLKTIYEDKNRQEAILRNEYDNWIIARPGFLNNGPLTENYKVITDLKGIKAGKISRADVADFILKQAKNPTYLQKTPLLTY
jgi:putative NADH-flavin reductase